MAHYIAIIEDAGPDHAVGVWFPDLPGCTSAGDDIDDALRNALIPVVTILGPLITGALSDLLGGGDALRPALAAQ